MRAAPHAWPAKGRAVGQSEGAPVQTQMRACACAASGPVVHAQRPSLIWHWSSASLLGAPPSALGRLHGAPSIDVVDPVGHSRVLHDFEMRDIHAASARFGSPSHASVVLHSMSGLAPYSHVVPTTSHGLFSSGRV